MPLNNSAFVVFLTLFFLLSDKKLSKEFSVYED